MDPSVREFVCISTLPPKQPLVNNTDYGVSDEMWTLDACWREIINLTGRYKVNYKGNDTACILNVPSEVRAGIIRWMTDKFEFSTIDCHIQFYDSEIGNSVTAYVMLALLFISMLCLILTVMVYAVKKELVTVPGLNLTCLCLSQFLHYLTGALSLFNVPHHLAPRSECVFFGFTRHFSILATFFWLNVMAYDIWSTVSRMEISNSKKVIHWKTFAKYSIYAWGVPLLFGLTAVIMDNIDTVPTGFKPCYQRPRVNDPDFRCAMKTTNIEGFLIYNIVPRTTVLLSNIVFFILTAMAIHRTRKNAEIMKCTRRAKTRYRLYVKLFIVMGLAWIVNVADFIIYAKIGPDWLESGPKWFNVLATYVTVFTGIGIYLTFGLIPSIKLIRLCCKKNDKRLSSQSTFNTTMSTSVKMSDGGNTIVTKF